jgi:adenosylcobinamide-GDP ribazoletransferase
MKKYVFGFILAMQFLTRIPIPIACPWEKQTIRGALASFGVIGFIIGGILASTLAVTASIFPTWICALLIVTLWVFLTGGLHLDGLMDVADAVGSNASLEKKLAIMKDPHVGSFAVLVAFFYLIWKVAIIYGLLIQTELSLHRLLFFVILIPAISRLLPLFLLYYLPLIKQEGLAYQWKQHLTMKEVAIASFVILFFTIFFPIMLLIISAYLLFFFLLRQWIMKNFKGINGDLLGASIEGGELWGLSTLWMYIWFVMV